MVSIQLQVAEIDKEIVGMIRGCIKTVTCGKKFSRKSTKQHPVYTKLAYILGLRVSPNQRYYHYAYSFGLNLCTVLYTQFLLY
jgi:hypothetical protein